jgi:hypothetical protein
MSKPSPSKTFLKPYIFLPQDHGSWVFLLSPLLIGIFAGGQVNIATPFLILGAFAAFLIRQPVTIWIKALSGRRSTADIKLAAFWIGVYGLLGLISLAGLTWLGYGFVLLLAVPALPVFAWHLWLVNRRAERRQIGVEILGSGVLALSATAAVWVGLGQPDPLGWWLWILTWFQSAASIVYAYLRLAQRELPEIPALRTRLGMGRRALMYTSFNFLAVLLLSMLEILPAFLWIPYAFQWGESIYGTLKPAVKVKPTLIGIRQLIVSIIFTITFIITWKI